SDPGTARKPNRFFGVASVGVTLRAGPTWRDGARRRGWDHAGVKRSGTVRFVLSPSAVRSRLPRAFVEHVASLGRATGGLGNGPRWPLGRRPPRRGGRASPVQNTNP